MFIANTHRETAPRPRPHLTDALGLQGRMEAGRLLALCPAHRATPLHALPKLAATLGVASIAVKDESHRFGLNSFKALGGAYAVLRLVLERAGVALDDASADTLRRADVSAAAAGMTFACATDGNHGRSVAAGARLAGAACVIFMHEGVSAARADAIAAFGARIVRVAGGYDASVREAARQAAEQGWTVVSDTSWDGYEAIPLTVMQGYTVMAGEAFDALGEAPTHVFVQAGVGGVAAAVAAHAQAIHARAVHAGDMPKIIIVEPERAACLAASISAGRLTAAEDGGATIMGMLECHEPSPIAWEVLAPLAAGCVTLPEEAAGAAMRRLARPEAGDPPIVAGESGAAGFAGLLACLADPSARAALGLDVHSRVLVFNTEGATDPRSYASLVGASPEEIRP